MPLSPFAEEARDRLAALDVRPRAMFGGYGLYIEDLMMGLIVNDRLFFKVADSNRADYEAAGSEPFTYGRAGKPAVSMSYFEVPADVMEDIDQLIGWAEKAHAAARALKKKPTGQKTSVRKKRQ